MSNGCYKLYFIQLSPKDGGNIVYKIGITEYKDVLHRFSNYIDEFNFKVLCSLIFNSKEKAEAFESMFLTIYNNWPSNNELAKYDLLKGQGELRFLTNKEKMELLNFMFLLRNNSKSAIIL